MGKSLENNASKDMLLIRHTGLRKRREDIAAILQGRRLFNDSDRQVAPGLLPTTIHANATGIRFSHRISWSPYRLLRLHIEGLLLEL